MGNALLTLGIDNFSVEGRVALVQDIWDSVAAETRWLLPSTTEINELNLRLDEDGCQCVGHWELEHHQDRSSRSLEAIMYSTTHAIPPLGTVGSDERST